MRSHAYTFIAENIQHLRRRAGLTQVALAKRMGLQQGALSRIESGDNIPSARTIYELARTLKISTDEILLRNERTAKVRHGDSPFLVDDDGIRLTDKTIATADRLVDACLALEDICGAPKHADLPLQLHFEPTADGIERLVARVRALMNIHHGVIFDYFELFEIQGFRVLALPLYRRIMSFSYYDPLNANAFFFINKRHNPEKQLFRLAYELGHLFVHTADHVNAGSVSGHLDAEHAARQFAALFLMPAEAVKATVRQLGIHDGHWTPGMLLRIKHRFGVSAESFLYRLEELELINTESNRNLRRFIKKHYAETGFAEPDQSRRLLTPNGRIWDLVETAREINGHRDEVRQIEQLLHEEHIERI